MRNHLSILLILAALLIPAAVHATPATDAPPLGPLGGDARELVKSPPVAPAQTAPDVMAEHLTLVEYSTPISATHVLAAPNGHIWYSGFFTPALGSLDPVSKASALYRLPTFRSVFGLGSDASGGIWYSTANSRIGNVLVDDVVGRLDPATGAAKEWALGRSHFGMHVDPETQAVWFVSKGAASDHLVRLSPETNQMTRWSIQPYTDTYNLDIAPDGNIWFTVQPYGLQGVGRLNPTTGQTTVWSLPAPDARPFQLHAFGPNEIWLTELDVAGNAISRLNPATNRLTRFPLPIQASTPAGIYRAGDWVWFTQYGRHQIGALELGGRGQEVTLRASTFNAPSITSFVTPTSVTTQISRSTAVATTRTVDGVHTGRLVEYPLPFLLREPLDLMVAADGVVWFTLQNAERIGSLQPLVLEPVLYLPLLR